MARIKKQTGFAPKQLATSSNAPTKEFQYKEIVRCGKDPLYFINTYVKISHPVKGYIPFKTFPYQDECVKQYLQHRFVITNKSRQLGLSTISAAYSLWMALFQREKNILVVATKMDVAKLFIKKVDDMFRALPSWLVMPNLTIKSVKEIGFSNGSRIKATPTSISAARGEALSLVIMDEAAHIEGIDEMWLAMYPALSTGGSAVLISTPKGVGNLFHRIWVGAQTKDNEFYPIELPWTVHPERDQAWFDSECKQIRASMGERGIAQELLCAFNGSGDTFLPGNVLDLLQTSAKDPIATHPLSADFWIWEAPVQNHKYIIPCDVASGSGKDYTTFHVIDITTDTIVGEFASNRLSIDEVSKLVLQIAQEYNTALLCPELNSYGLILSKNIKDANYPNVYYERFRNAFSAYLTDQDIKPQDMPGIYTGPKNRDEMLAKLETVLRNGHLRVYSKRIVEEFKTFVWKGSRAEAMKGYNDDLIMALAIGTFLFETSGLARYSEDEFSKAMLFSIAKSSTSLSMNANGYGNPVHNISNVLPPIYIGNSNNAKLGPNPLSSIKEHYTQAQKAHEEFEKQQAYERMYPGFSWLLR